jgi:tRNA A37 N6-isopentenylltransferase MiaA
MKDMASLFEGLEIKDLAKSIKPRTRRDVENMFYEELKKWHQLDEKDELRRANIERRKPKLWKMIPYPRMVMMLKGMKTVAELEWFLGYCKESKHFAKCFYAKLRVDK